MLTHLHVLQKRHMCTCEIQGTTQTGVAGDDECMRPRLGVQIVYQHAFSIDKGGRLVLVCVPVGATPSQLVVMRLRLMMYGHDCVGNSNSKLECLSLRLRHILPSCAPT